MKQIIITIGRQFGSGGRNIGRRLADELGIAYYDKELLAEAAKVSGLSDEFFERADEKPSASGLSYALTGFPNIGFYTPYQDVLSREHLFLLQSNAIRDIVAKGESCVLVGRCADYVLRDHEGLLSFFVHNTRANRIRNIIERQSLSEEEAIKLMKKTDQSRASYYKYYTDKEWGMASSYHFTVDLSQLGLEGTVELIKTIVAKKYK